MPVAVLALLLALPTAQATKPLPDRPLESASGYLVAVRSLELELGGRWQQAFTVPARLKLGAASVFEPRVGFDLAGLDQGRPDLVVEAKFGLLQKEGAGLALLAMSGFPIAEGEAWHGSLRGLLSLPLDHVELRFNAGVDLRGSADGGQAAVAFAGVPVSAALALPFASSFAAWFEAGTVAGAGWDQALLGSGLQWRLTEIMILDSGVGWDLGAGSPFVHLGLTANLGRIGG